MSTVNINKLQKILKFVCGIKKNKDINIPCLIWGKHGIGKTEITRQVANEIGYDCVTLNLANQSPEELLGLCKIEGSIVKYYRPEWLKLDSDRPVLYFLDEILRAPTFVTQSMFNFILEGRLHTHQIRNYDMVVAANNPDSDEYSIQSFNDKAFESRFAHLYLEPNNDEVIMYFNSKRCHNSVISIFKDSADICNNSVKYDDRIHVTPNNRMMMKVGLLLNEISENEFNDFGLDLIHSMVGAEVGSLIAGKYKDTLHIESPENILNGKPLKITFNDIQKINVTNSRLVEYLLDNYNFVDSSKKKISSKEKENFKNYLNKIPKDCATALIKEFNLKLGTNVKIVEIVNMLFKTKKGNVEKDLEFIMNLMEIK